MIEQETSDESTPPLTLAAVESEFAEWRRRRSPRHTPSPLKAQAVSLLREHSISQVCQRLGINHGTLTRWRQALTPKPEAMGFVELACPAVEGLPASGDARMRCFLKPRPGQPSPMW